MRRLVLLVFSLPMFLLTWLVLVRVIRFFYKFPMPEFMAPVIDNPWRRSIQPPDEMPLRHGIDPGMTVLEVGPGNGRYTAATARRVGDKGRVVAVDIEPKMIERLNHRLQAEGIGNVEGRIADVYDLPFDDGWFDAIYLITVIGEIPEPMRAMREFHRVLSPRGTLAFSEFFPDPDYPRSQSLIRLAAQAGFQPRNQLGTWFAYTLVFEKCSL